MSDINLTDDEIIHRLSHRPLDTFNGVISVDEWNGPPPVSIRYERPFSLGKLDRLPLELLHESCGYLDVQSLTRLSRVSLRGTSVVETLSVYKELFKFAGYIFKIFQQARILNLHSIATLDAALHSKQCVSCGNFGPFLHIITAQRCCFVCLLLNASFWVMPPSVAQECFGLTTRRLDSLPIMWTIPSRYSIANKTWRRDREPLTSVHAAKEAALRVHGLLDVMRCTSGDWSLPMSKGVFFGKCRRAPPLRRAMLQDSLMELKWYRVSSPWDNFGGMGAMAFPAIDPKNTIGSSSAEWGLWCQGCEWTYGEYRFGRIDDGVLACLVPQGCDVEGYLLGMRYRAWTREEFLQHARHCYSGAAFLNRT